MSPSCDVFYWRRMRKLASLAESGSNILLALLNFRY
jgi:hypothetical protein